MIIKTWRDPYEAGFTPTKPREIELHPGLTVLVGCNGAGKSTLLKNISEICKTQHIPCLIHDNLQDGGHNAFAEMLAYGNYEEGAYLFSSSEGECIKANFGRKTKLFAEFVEKGIVNDRLYKFAKIFSDKEDIIESNSRVFLFDAVDSGLSVDSVIEVKEVFNVMLDDFKDSGKEIYIIIAANEYELARNADCFDVNTGQYLRFNDYEDYRTFIIKSRQRKEKRIHHQIVWRAKQKQKEIQQYLKIKEQQKIKLEALDQKRKRGERVLFWDEDNIKRMDQDFLRNTARFITEKDIEKLETIC